MVSSLKAELLLFRKRVSFYVLLGFWTGLMLLFTYILPYYAFKNNLKVHGQLVGAAILPTLLPQNMVNLITVGFPFFGGVFVLILGALAMGSEYNWYTLTPILVQRDSRLKVFLSKIAAVGIVLIPFVLVVFLFGYIASALIAWREGQSETLPAAWDIIRAMGAGWFLLAAWASFGVLLAVISRGTAMAIGLGIIYGLVIENLIEGFSSQIDLLATLSKGLLRTNGYSLISSLGAVISGGEGPGGFSGQGVSALQASIFLGIYIVLFVGVAAGIVRRRDVAGAG